MGDVHLSREQKVKCRHVMIRNRWEVKITQKTKYTRSSRGKSDVYIINNILDSV